ncbi:MAG: LysR family transcriptional regulator [Hyphomicrobiales bacterium]|nr:LysR family transcriptional regulator [Hyphomicrobiales bacterium]
MDRLDAMAVLLAVVSEGSLSGAGRKLGMPLPTISRKLSELEDHLGARLVIRSSRQLSLTEAGRSYTLACQRILEQVDEAERAAGGEYSAPRGSLVIAAPVVFGRLHVLPAVTEFLKAYPEIDVRLIQSDRNAHILEDHIDVALRIGNLPDSSQMAIRLGEVHRVACASPQYLAQRGVPETPDSLSGHDCISFDVLTSPEGWLFRESGSDRLVPVTPRLVVNTAEAAIDAATSGLGITRVLSYQSLESRRARRLEPVLVDFQPPAWPVSLVYAAQGQLPLKLRAFLDFAVPRLKATIQQAAG